MKRNLISTAFTLSIACVAMNSCQSTSPKAAPVAPQEAIDTQNPSGETADKAAEVDTDATLTPPAAAKAAKGEAAKAKKAAKSGQKAKAKGK